MTPGCSSGWRWKPHHSCKSARWQTGSMTGKTPTRRAGTCLRKDFPKIVQCGRTSSFALAPWCSPGARFLSRCPAALHEDVMAEVKYMLEVKELAETMSLGATSARVAGCRSCWDGQERREERQWCETDTPSVDRNFTKNTLHSKSGARNVNGSQRTPCCKTAPISFIGTATDLAMITWIVTVRVRGQRPPCRRSVSLPQHNKPLKRAVDKPPP